MPAGPEPGRKMRLDWKETLLPAQPTGGGIEGGISNGQPIVIRAAMKPIATTLTAQATVDLASGEPTSTRYERSDFCRYPGSPDSGGNGGFCSGRGVDRKLGGIRWKRCCPFSVASESRLEDLIMDGAGKVWWSSYEAYLPLWSPGSGKSTVGKLLATV